MSPELLLWLVASVALTVLCGREVSRAISRTETGHAFRRWLCRRVGHVPFADERGRPVTAFYVCIRCGKIGGRIE